jgi:hypothetical protein
MKFFNNVFQPTRVHPPSSLRWDKKKNEVKIEWWLAKGPAHTKQFFSGLIKASI